MDGPDTEGNDGDTRLMSPSFLSVLEKTDRMANSRQPVLLMGETGTGKSLLAHGVVKKSPRRDKPFVTVNCACLSRDLAASEIFGHVRGAFTSAHAANKGLLSSAQGGTLFLDEIAELDLAVQAKLLRFLETGLYRMVGAAEERAADVRVIAASHRPLIEWGRQGIFREDLYHRLAVLTLFLPPLRERREDILPLARRFLKQALEQENRKGPVGFDVAAEKSLVAYDWPGNIRELRNMIFRAVALHEALPLMTLEALGLVEQANREKKVFHLVSSQAAGGRPRPLWQVEQEAILAALSYCGGNVPKAAALLEVSPSTLYRRDKKDEK